MNDDALKTDAFGRYQVAGVLGEGGFGVVYRGFDPELRREVAIKVPRSDVIRAPAEAEAYVNEARVLASLNHSGIVPVYDCGRTDSGLCYVVSQLIHGENLAERIAKKRPSHSEAADIVARIGDALHHAHQHGLVHRDVKPANILIDESGHPRLVDFGLALTDDSYGRTLGISGTPAYMSPEQASGQGHLLDARSDIYSLGVVFYELLAGRRPYRSSRAIELLQEIISGELRPPRQFDHMIPHELERTCLKALAKRPRDRYTTASDLAEDLRRWRSQHETATLSSLPPATKAPAKRPVRRRLLFATGVICVAALVSWPFISRRTIGYASRQAGNAHDTGSGDEAPAAPRTDDLAEPPRVRSLEVQHYARLNDHDAVPRGVVGKQSFTPRLGDQVTIDVELERPAYCYLVAFRPDGVAELCLPEDETQAPPQTDRLRCPLRADKAYGLREGTGLWVFAVVASQKPLPAYSNVTVNSNSHVVVNPGSVWPPQAPTPGSDNRNVRNRGIVWWYDGHWIDPMAAPGVVRGDRSNGEDALGTSSSVVHVADWLKDISHAETVGAIGFHVSP